MCRSCCEKHNTYFFISMKEIRAVKPSMCRRDGPGVARGRAAEPAQPVGHITQFFDVFHAGEERARYGGGGGCICTRLALEMICVSL